MDDDVERMQAFREKLMDFTSSALRNKEVDFHDMTTVLLGTVFHIFKNVYKQTDEEVINFLSDAYVKYPSNDGPDIPMRNM